MISPKYDPEDEEIGGGTPSVAGEMPPDQNCKRPEAQPPQPTNNPQSQQKDNDMTDNNTTATLGPKDEQGRQQVHHNTHISFSGQPTRPYPIGTMYDPRIGSVPWFWMWLFGPFYLMYKGLWGHAVIWLLTFWLVIPPFIYIFKARELVYHRMLLLGRLN